MLSLETIVSGEGGTYAKTNQAMSLPKVSLAENPCEPVREPPQPDDLVA